MKEKCYLTLNRCFSDISEFRLYCDDEMIGSAKAHIVPVFPISMQCGGLFLTYKRDPDVTLVPGVSIPIIDATCGEEFGRVFWDGQGKHRLHTPYGYFRLKYQEGIYLITKDNGCVGGVTYVQEGSPAHMKWSSEHTAEKEEDWDFRLAMTAAEEFPNELALLLQLFPLLAIGP